MRSARRQRHCAAAGGRVKISVQNMRRFRDHAFRQTHDEILQPPDTRRVLNFTIPRYTDSLRLLDLHSRQFFMFSSNRILLRFSEISGAVGRQ